MKKALLVNTFIVSLLFFFGMAVRSADAAMPLPSGSGFYQYSSIENPVLSDDPSLAQPLSVGSVAVGGETLSMRISLHEISGAVDLYFGLYLPILDPVNIYLLDTNNAFGTLAQGLVPFRQNVEGVIDEAIFGDLPVQGLPKGTYQVYLLVTPAGSLESYYFWQTSFFVGGWSITEVEAPIMSAFGERGAFDALLEAFNKGYSLEQIVEGSVSDRLQASGDIIQYGSSNVEATHYPPLDFLVSSGMEKMGELHIQGILTTDELYNKFKNAAKGPGHILYLLLALSSLCFGADEGHDECFSFCLVLFIDVTAPEGCTTNCVPCIKFSDGTTKCPPEKGVIDLTKSFSGLGVTVTGPPSLKVGEAGTWTAAAVNGIEPFTYYFNWGDKSYTESTANAAQHSYSKAGNYNVVVRVDETVSGNDAVSSALPVEVREAAAAAFPYLSVSLMLQWNDSRFSLALVAVKDSLSNLQLGVGEPTVYYGVDAPSYPETRLIPDETGTYIVAAYANGFPLSMMPECRDGQPVQRVDMVNVAFTLTVEETPFNYFPERETNKYEFGETSTRIINDSVIVDPNDSCLDEPHLGYGEVRSITTVTVKRP
jgi:hypothetical protein